MSLDEHLRVVIQHAKALRDAGVTRYKDGDVEFDLQPDIPELKLDSSKSEDGPKSPLNDAATYGYAEGSSMPGFRDPRRANQ